MKCTGSILLLLSMLSVPAWGQGTAEDYDRAAKLYNRTRNTVFRTAPRIASRVFASTLQNVDVNVVVVVRGRGRSGDLARTQPMERPLGVARGTARSTI